jgi:hypothetical protein
MLKKALRIIVQLWKEHKRDKLRRQIKWDELESRVERLESLIARKEAENIINKGR